MGREWEELWSTMDARTTPPGRDDVGAARAVLTGSNRESGVRCRVIRQATGGDEMKSTFSAVFEKDGDWFIGYCLEVSGANGQGKTLDECRENLREAIKLILEDRREDGLRGLPEGAIQEDLDVA